MMIGKIIKVLLRINAINWHSLTSSFSSINPFSFNSCNLRNIKIILFDLIQGNGVPYLLSKDFASCFAKMTNENQITKKTSKTTKKIIFFKLLRFRITKSMNKRLQQYLQGKSQNPRRAHTLKHSNLYLLNQKCYADKKNSLLLRKY